MGERGNNPTFATDGVSGSLSLSGRRTEGDPPSCLAGLPKNRPSCEAGNLLRALFPHTARANQISRIKSRCTKLNQWQRAYYFATCCGNVAYPSQSNQTRAYRPTLGRLVVAACDSLPPLWGRVGVGGACRGALPCRLSRPPPPTPPQLKPRIRGVRPPNKATAICNSPFRLA